VTYGESFHVSGAQRLANATTIVERTRRAAEEPIASFEAEPVSAVVAAALAFLTAPELAAPAIPCDAILDPVEEAEELTAVLAPMVVMDPSTEETTLLLSTLALALVEVD
jgi:hypothetical protein